MEKDNRSSLRDQEKYRPQFHFTPEKNWMNDPNGLVYYEGKYHMFYQYHPYSTEWGPMHWGHAVSTDLVHWKDISIALYPDENGTIFSGCIVVDWHDSSGFFNGKSGLVAIFTHNDTYPDSERPRQRQSLAYSKDQGRTWIKYDENPVLEDEKITDFRDPKVFYHEETQYWIMVLAAGNCVKIYRSKNLKNWDFQSSFGEQLGNHDGVWECPDLFELNVQNQPKLTQWVMIVSVGDATQLENGSRTQYFVGRFDGHTFKVDDEQNIHWLDVGKDNYAGISWSDVKDGRRLYIGWMSNWRYANVVPTKKWRSSMTIPRELVLQSAENGFSLSQKPIKELAEIRDEHIHFTNLIVKPNDNPIQQIKGKTWEILAEFEIGIVEEFGLKVCQFHGEETIIGYSVSKEELFVDRRKSGESSFQKSFASKERVHLKADKNRIKLHVFVDWSSVEVFANVGRISITDLIFPDDKSDGLEVFSIGGEVKLLSLDLYRLRAI